MPSCEDGGLEGDALVGGDLDERGVAALVDIEVADGVGVDPADEGAVDRAEGDAGGGVEGGEAVHEHARVGGELDLV